MAVKFCRFTAVIKLGSTKSANNSLSYADSRAIIKSGLNCDSDYSKEQFVATRLMWGKNDSIQAHTIIQSFEPGEVTPEQANLLGKQLAKRVAKGYEVAIFTHSDKDHIHNHIIINAVHPDTGRKFHCHGREGIMAIRLASDELCKLQGLSLPERAASVRHTLAEQSLLEKGKDSWKDELRQAVDIESNKSASYMELKINLKNKYGIVVDDTRKHITFTHPDGKKARGYKLGDNYTKEGLQRGIERQIEDRSTSRSNETGRGIGIKPGIDSSTKSLGGMERGIRGVSKLDKPLRELTPTGRRKAEAAQRAAEEANRRVEEQRAALERQQQELTKKIKHHSYDLER